MYVSQILKKKRVEKGLTQQDLADAIGVSAVAVSKWELGQSKPRKKFHEKLSEILGVNEKVISGSEKITKSDYVEIPYYNVKAAAGHGYENDELYDREVELVPIEALKYAQKSSVFCIKASGDSMVPVFFDGAKLAIDSSKTIVKDGDLYVVSYDGCLRVKVLFKTLNGIRLCSYNSMFKDEEYTHEELTTFRVIGKVIWYSQVIKND
uniref:HTH cro/C1-type domain-containing protein n=1 Tax=Vibrio sp. 23023 TaxID=452803 RepID=A9M4M8_9VIBR|nr:LexA family transcriptional regulator [Vibrio sp. 23023]ABX77020.1 H-T-H motif hypothetical protein [Vibrio sp. 23023]